MQEKILVIQTENASLKAFDTVLGNEYKLILKHDGLEALEWLEKGNYADLIIADAAMPYLNSLDFIKELRSRHLYRSVPLLILSELERVMDRNSFIQAGATDFVVKPMSKSQLKQRVRQLLENSNLDAQETRLAS